MELNPTPFPPEMKEKPIPFHSIRPPYAGLIVSKLISSLTLALLNDDVFKFLFLSTYVESEFFLRRKSKWSQWSDQKIKELLIIFNINSCLFIQDFSKINLWFSNLIINKNVKLLRCSFTVKIKYITCQSDSDIILL